MGHGGERLTVRVAPPERSERELIWELGRKRKREDKPKLGKVRKKKINKIKKKE